MANAITRPPQPTTSSRCAGRTIARTTPTRSVVTTIAVPRFSDLISRSAATSTRVVPRSPRVAGVRASGAAPPAVCATASRHANAMASMTARGEDLEAASQRARAPAEGRARPLVREVIDAVCHQADLPSGLRRVADELGRRGDHELDRLGVGLDPVLLVRGDVHEEYRIEARGGLAEPRVQLAHAGPGLPLGLPAGRAPLQRPRPPG